MLLETNRSGADRQTAILQSKQRAVPGPVEQFDVRWRVDRLRSWRSRPIPEWHRDAREESRGLDPPTIADSSRDQFGPRTGERRARRFAERLRAPRCDDPFGKVLCPR